MKGKLINKDQKWIVQYEEVDNTSFGIAAATGGAIIPSVKELPLHPDDAKDRTGNTSNKESNKMYELLFENEEVEFEIVEETLSNLDGDMRKNYKFAKLIQSEEDYFKSVREGITQFTKQSGYSVYIPEDAKKQEETTTWDDIFERLAIKSNNFDEFWEECEKIKSEYIEPSRK